ncbi:MAG: twin-arginine translocation signal domain-containing protein [Planctomycetota bacterium]
MKTQFPENVFQPSYIMKDNISRRTFLKAGIAVGTGLCGLSYLSSFERPRSLKTLKGRCSR